jgi:glycosyltransferase involved in cell wall biosynthesis
MKTENGQVSEIDVREIGAEANRFEIRTLSFSELTLQIEAQPRACISVIIAAYNEQDTIAEVVRAAETHPLIDEVIVVDDGSRDQTVERARTTSAKVLSMSTNSGKAAAMNRGVQAARNDIILFLDADILGLTHEMITLIVMPVITGKCGMFVAIRDRRTYWLNRLLYFIPVLGGERALRKQVWSSVPRTYRKGFQIEIALNYYTKKSGHKMGFAVMPGLTQVIKEKKRGFWLGLGQRIKMSAEVLWISLRLYVSRNFVLWLSRRRASVMAQSPFSREPVR